ncbi:MAG: hypothetical protein MJ239_05580, partial [Bacilli bacterium]|nr:hypothetical protein [Bacilli bacterium]
GMRKKPLLTFVSSLAIALCACSSNGKADFSFKDNIELPYFSRRGENFLQRSATINTIETVTTSADSGRLIEELNKGRDIPLYIYQHNCEHCRKFETKMVNYCLDSMTEIYSMDLSSGAGEIYKLVEAFPSFGPILNDLSTPSIFFLNKREAKTIDFHSHMSTADDFEKFMAPIYNNTRIYRYSTYSGFAKCAEETEGLLYIDNGSNESLAFETMALQNSIHHDKRLAWIEWNRLNNDDKESFRTLFGIESESIVGIYKKGGTLNSSVNYVSESESAKDLVSSYYAN